MERNAFFPGLAAVVRWVACWCTAFWLFTLTSPDGPQGIRFLPFLIGALLCYLILRRFLTKPRTVHALTALGVGLTAALSSVLLWKFSDLSGLVPRLFCLLAVGTTVYTAVSVSLETPAAAKCISGMELTTLYFLVFVWAINMADLDPLYLLPLLLSLVLSLLVVPYQRLLNSSNAHGHHRGVVIVAAVLAVILLILVLFVTFGAAPLGQGVSILAGALLAAGKSLLAALDRFILWLASLLPQPAPGELPDMEPLPSGGELIISEDPSPVLMAILLGIAVLLASAAVLFLLHYFRGHRLGGKAPHSINRESIHRNRPSLLKWLRQLFSHLFDCLRLQVRILSMRGTPQELYHWLTRRARRLHCPRQPGETPAAFLHRLQKLAQEDTDLSNALEQLVQALNQSLYGRVSAPLSAETVRYIRRGVRKLRAA